MTADVAQPERSNIKCYASDTIKTLSHGLHNINQ